MRRDFPNSAMASSTGLNASAAEVSAYSTVGGAVGWTVRRTSPSASSSRSLTVRTFGETPARSRLRSPKRLGPSRRNHKILGVQAEESSVRHSSSGQSSEGGCRGGDFLIGKVVTFRNLLLNEYCCDYHRVVKDRIVRLRI
jgi:hypothetical protein